MSKAAVYFICYLKQNFVGYKRKSWKWFLLLQLPTS